MSDHRTADENDKKGHHDRQGSRSPSSSTAGNTKSVETSGTFHFWFRTEACADSPAPKASRGTIDLVGQRRIALRIHEGTDAIPCISAARNQEPEGHSSEQNRNERETIGRRKPASTPP